MQLDIRMDSINNTSGPPSSILWWASLYPTQWCSGTAGSPRIKLIRRVSLLERMELESWEMEVCQTTKVHRQCLSPSACHRHLMQRVTGIANDALLESSRNSFVSVATHNCTTPPPAAGGRALQPLNSGTFSLCILLMQKITQLQLLKFRE